MRTFTLPAQMDASLPFELLTEPAVSNSQDAAVVHEEAGTVDPGASVPRRLKPSCSLVQFDDDVVGFSANPTTSYLPLVVFGIDRPRGIGASQLQANEPFGHRQRRQISCYSRGGNRPGRSAPFYCKMLTPSTAAATDLPEGTKGPSESHKGAHGQHTKDAPGYCRPKVPEHPQARTINHVSGPTTPSRSGTRVGPCGKDSSHGPFNQKGDTPPSPAQIPLSRRG